MKKVTTAYRTRPEGVRMAPVIRRLEKDPRFESISVATGRHREMLDQVGEVLGITPTYNLNVFAPGQTLDETMVHIIMLLDPTLEIKRPDAVVVQDGISIVAAVTLASFNQCTPVVHLGAGLRSGDIAMPLPGEANRSIATRTSLLHLTLAQWYRVNLEREEVHSKDVTVTGNTVIDAPTRTMEAEVPVQGERICETIASNIPILLVTAHRCEN